MAKAKKRTQSKTADNKSTPRFCLEQDEDSHWYLIPVEMKEMFSRMCEKAYADDEYGAFNDSFEEMRINGPQNLTFADPKEE